MAVDTRDKRASAVSVLAPWRLVLPSPGTIDQADRQHVAHAYRGIPAGGGGTVAAYPDPYAATSTSSGADPYGSTSTASGAAPYGSTSTASGADPYASTSGLLGS